MRKYEFKYLLIIMAVAASSWLIYSCTSATGGTNPEKKQTAQPADEGRVIFFEDFSGPGLDRTKWNAEVTGMHVNDELQAYVDSAAVIRFASGAEAGGADNGALLLRPVYSPGYTTSDGRKFDFISGRINTRGKMDFSYGTAAARIKVTAGAGLWPAWWMLGNDAWPETGEIDIMEYVGETDWVSAAVHGKGYSGDAGLVNRLYFPANNDATQWHVYAVDWTPDSLVFKYDNVPMFRVTKPMTSFFGNWAFDTPKYLILNFAVGGVYPFKINGIRQPYYGLSADALERIKNGKASMLVDWVKVTAK